MSAGLVADGRLGPDYCRDIAIDPGGLLADSGNTNRSRNRRQAFKQIVARTRAFVEPGCLRRETFFARSKPAIINTWLSYRAPC